MLKRLIVFVGMATGVLSLNAQGLDQQIDQKVKPVSDFIESVVFFPIPIGGGATLPVVLLFLIFAAVYCTIYFKFPNVRYFKLAMDTVRGRYIKMEKMHSHIHENSLVNIVDGDIVDTIKNENLAGEVNHFQALSSALSGTLGLGNISGVAIAIAIGGPGATFWMILSGLLGMASKFTECTLGIKYRDIGPDGTVYGGPMYYLSKGLAVKGMARLGKVLAVIFAVFCIGGTLGGGNMFQSNQTAEMFKYIFKFNTGYSGFLVGVFMAMLIGLVILGGIKRIAAVAERVVPFMCGLYIIACLLIVFMNLQFVPEAFSAIIKGAFYPDSIAGGMIGVLIMGFRRACFSNEAGIGSAPIAHSAVRTNFPASEGIVSLLEPFVDTVIVCTMTAIVIIVSNAHYHFLDYGANNGLNGVTLTSVAFESVIPGFSYVLGVAVFLFAFSTMISWSYYGLQAWVYLFGRTKRSANVYKLLFLFFVIVGGSIQLKSVVGVSDSLILAMVFPNLVGLIILAPNVKEELARYLVAIKEYKIKLVK
ncbi:MAG TPA: alanine/glycine:cation symporter family protein [Saprospiraceae bacterium]|nr:alanine/glycine:cation symporter family protein [Saprospiraceae bacterium]